MKNPAVMIVEDDANLRFVLDECLKHNDYTTILATDGQQAIDYYESYGPDLILLDIKIPKINGLKVLERIKSTSPDTAVIVLTGHATVSTAVEAMKQGAFDFITKPFEVDELVATLDKASQTIQIRNENIAALNSSTATDEPIYRSQVSVQSKQLDTMISNIALSDYTILLEGESGTGKSLWAKEIHMRSNRKDGPFVLVDCASLPDNLIESELFGYEKGAFTGATSQKIGKIERANGGTLFLDEISTLNLNSQANLLTVIQNREFERLGGYNPIPVDVRIIAASNQNLKQLIKEKTFRHDLYYRLNVFNLVLPTLNERKEDILPLAYFFIKKFENREGITLSTEAAIKLKNYAWPGNIRELENVIKRALILIKDEKLIESRHLPLDLNQGYWACRDKTLGLKSALEEMEKMMIEQTLLENDFNIEKCAEVLKISKRTLYYRLKRLGIDLHTNRP